MLADFLYTVVYVWLDLEFGSGAKSGMQAGLVRIFAACLLFCLTWLSVISIAGCSTTKNQESGLKSNADKESIMNVLKQMETASEKFTNTVNQLKHAPTFKAVTSGVGYVVQEYANDLAAIDISKCPEDFRVVYAKYYIAVLDMKQYADANTGWRQVLKGVTAFFTVNPTVLTGLPDRTDKAVSPLEVAAKELTLVLAKYNIQN